MTPAALAQRWRERPRHDSRWRVLVLLGAVGLLGGVVALVAYYWTPGSVYTLALAVGSPYLVLGALAGAALFAVARQVSGWIGFGSCLAILAWSVLVHAPLFVGDDVPAGRDVVVMTANLRLGGADPASVVAAVRAQHVQVLMLEEVTPEETAALDAAGIGTLLPHAKVIAGNASYGTGLLSRYRLSAVDVRTDFGFGFLTARVAVPGTSPAPTMVALHMFGPYPQPQTPQWVRDIKHLRAVLVALPTDAPVIVGGDFNATDDVSQLRDVLASGYADAADQAGAGFTPTYPADHWWGPVLAIDHVLTRGAVAHQVDSVSITGSDHRALVATVRLPTR